MESTTATTTELIPSTTHWDLAHRICATAMVVVVVAVCALTLFSAIFVGASALWDPNDVVTLQHWTSAIGFTARSGTGVVIAAAMVLAVVATVTVIAAWRHQRTWFIAGVISGALIVGTLVYTSTIAFQQLNSVIAHTHDRIGPVNLATEEPVPGAERGEEVGQGVPTAVTQATAEAEVLRMVAAIEAAGVGPLTPIDGETGVPADAALENSGTIPLQAESCLLDADGQIGNQIGIQIGATFVAPSDAAGTQLRAALTAWKVMGYSVTDRQRDSYLFSDSVQPIYTARINDSFTIDGNMRVTIASVCASTAVAE